MQKTVGNYQLGLGRTGEFRKSDNQRTQGAILTSATEANNIVGRVVKHVASNDIQVGIAASGNLAGILGFPKSSVRPTLDPQAFLSNGTQCEFIEAGYVIVELPAVAAIGDFVYYSDTDGTLITAAPGVAPAAGHTRLPGGKVDEFNVTAAGQAVIYFDVAGSTETPV